MAERGVASPNPSCVLLGGYRPLVASSACLKNEQANFSSLRFAEPLGVQIVEGGISLRSSTQKGSKVNFRFLFSLRRRSD